MKAALTSVRHDEASRKAACVVMPLRARRNDKLHTPPATEQLLVSGGDARISLDSLSGQNKYGCRPYPDASLLAFGSSTASVISAAGFAAAEALRERLMLVLEHDAFESGCEQEFRRIRLELLASFGLPDASLAFAASGTDAHELVARHVADASGQPLTVVMVEESETGSGVAAALRVKNASVVAVPLRDAGGQSRPLVEIDAEVSKKVDAAIRSGARVLLVKVDQSKTGLVAPGSACVAALHERYAGKLDVLVDACQLRVAAPALQTYLRLGYMVALTGSKFLTGPSFSAALLLPKALAHQLNLPKNDAGVAHNVGLLLRWEAALAELRRFRAVPPAVIAAGMRRFAQAVSVRLENDPRFQALPVPPLAKTQEWDGIQSIFPFVLYRPDGAGGRVPLDREQTRQIYHQLAGDDAPRLTVRCQLGQPVACGMREGVQVSALRLCLSARLISDAAEGKGMDGVIAEAMKVLDRAAGLVD